MFKTWTLLNDILPLVCLGPLIGLNKFNLLAVIELIDSNWIELKSHIWKGWSYAENFYSMEENFYDYLLQLKYFYQICKYFKCYESIK